MKTKYVFINLIILLIAENCTKDNENSKNTLTTNDTLEIKCGETLYNYEVKISIYLDSILSDSRCPKNGICKWLGNAELRFIFSNDSNNTNFILNTHGGENYRDDTLITGYKIMLLELTPYPDSTEIIQQKDYNAEILISI